MDKTRLIVGMTCASGAPITVEILRQLKRHPDIETHFVCTSNASLTLKQETDLSIDDLYSLADVVYDNQNIGAAIASGTFPTAGMIVVPCSMKTAAGIICGYSDSLLLRAADVTIKEGRKLVLVPRETPLSPIHLRNLYELSRIGVAIVPPMITYYSGAEKISDCTVHIAGKILDQFHIKCEGFQRWGEKAADEVKLSDR